jgi:cytochrome c biogenesis protein CcmG/thiol:disulfide interchange protein DsbE
LAGSLGLAGAFLSLVGIKLARNDDFGGFGVNATGRKGDVRNRPAPDFTIEQFDGSTFQLSRHRGEVVLLNFWASWCPPCQIEAPALERAWRKYGDRGLVVFGLDVWDERADAMKFIEKDKISYPNGLKGGGSVAVEYGVTGLPETFVIDRRNVLVRRWIGPLDDRRIASLVEPLLSE